MEGSLSTMKIAFFNSKPYDIQVFNEVNRAHEHEIVYLEPRLDMQTVQLAAGYPAVCVFVNDQLSRPVLKSLADHGSRTVALRCAGFNNVDIDAANELKINVVRVPRYSPSAVAEHTIGLILSLNRKIHRAYNRIKEGNFSLDGLLGFDLHGKTAGIIGTGNIGSMVVKILRGFGMRVLAFDPQKNSDCLRAGAEDVVLDELYALADIITMHCPLTPQTHHLIDDSALQKMKHGVMLVNTSRGAVIDTTAVISALKSGGVGYLGLDVYEQEGDLFFRDLSDQIIEDDVFERLITFPNVLITGHQGFFTREALEHIAQTTLQNVALCKQGCPTGNLVTSRLFI